MIDTAQANARMERALGRLVLYAAKAERESIGLIGLLADLCNDDDSAFSATETTTKSLKGPADRAFARFTEEGARSPKSDIGKAEGRAHAFNLLSACTKLDAALVVRVKDLADRLEDLQKARNGFIHDPIADYAVGQVRTEEDVWPPPEGRWITWPNFGDMEYFDVEDVEVLGDAHKRLYEKISEVEREVLEILRGPDDSDAST